MLERRELAAGPAFEGPARETDVPCLLQYTSGSTAEPKGVMIHHRNLRQHLAALQPILPGIRSGVSWLPPYHDMGLVLKLLFAMEEGYPLTFFTPDRFHPASSPLAAGDQPLPGEF